MTAPRGAVVVGVAKGPDSGLAVRWAAAEAERRAVALHLVHAMDNAHREIPLTGAGYRQLQRRAERVIADARAALPEGFSRPVTVAIDDGPAPAVLVRASAGAALTVVGAHGHPVGFDLLVGSVSVHLAHHATSPVAVIREQADPAARRILVGVDGSTGSEAALGFAFDAAAHEGVPVTALHGWTEPFPDAGDLGERIGRHEELLRAAVAPWSVKYPEVAVEAESAPVHPARLLTDAAAHAHLLVVGARGRGAFSGMGLGSVGQAALHHARCPVAIAR
jgi:nucleotide-binding universal stress UspA family protein